MEPTERIRMCRMLEKMKHFPDCCERLGIRNTSHETKAGKKLCYSGSNIDLRIRDEE